MLIWHWVQDDLELTPALLNHVCCCKGNRSHCDAAKACVIIAAISKTSERQWIHGLNCADITRTMCVCTKESKLAIAADPNGKTLLYQDRTLD